LSLLSAPLLDLHLPKHGLSFAGLFCKRCKPVGAAELFDAIHLLTDDAPVM
jgi:hypothetical protein